MWQQLASSTIISLCRWDQKKHWKNHKIHNTPRLAGNEIPGDRLGKEAVTGSSSAVTALVPHHGSHLWHQWHSLGERNTEAAAPDYGSLNFVLGEHTQGLPINTSSWRCKGGSTSGRWIWYSVNFTLMHCVSGEWVLPHWFYKTSTLSVNYYTKRVTLIYHN